MKINNYYGRSSPKTPGVEAQQPIGSTDPESGRTVTQPDDSLPEAQERATDAAPELKQKLEQAISSIKGAHLDSVREEKDPERAQEKVSEQGQPPETISDLLAARISVDSPEAKDQVVEALRSAFAVVKDEDKFEQGDQDNGFRSHDLQLQLSNGSSAEVQIVPREVLAAEPETHDNYEEGRDAENSGDQAAADKAQAENRQIHGAAMQKFRARNGEGEEKASEQGGAKPSAPAPEKEYKYKFGNTQVEVPPDSDAHKAIKAMQARIPKEHLSDVHEDQDKPHVTVRYGVKDGDTSGLKNYIAKQKPFEAKLGKTMAFPVSEHSEGAVPIVAHVESPDLHRINGEIEKHGSFAPSSFPDYKPHVTVAYVKPEHAQKYVGMKDGEGKGFKVGAISVGDRDGKKESVPIGEPQNRFSKGQHVSLPDGRSGRVDFHDHKVTGNARVTADDGERIQSIPGKKLTAVTPVNAKEGSEHICVDLDGTLATYSKFKGPTVIGAPIPAMVERVKQMLAKGEDVRIMTARVADDKDGKSTRAIQAWCQRYLGRVLPITNVKDQHTKAIYDDRAVAVEKNTGKILGGEENETPAGKIRVASHFRTTQQKGKKMSSNFAQQMFMRRKKAPTDDQQQKAQPAQGSPMQQAPQTADDSKKKRKNWLK